MNKLRIAFGLGLALAAGLASADQVYKWVDKDGHVHFSQTPPAGTGVQAQTVDVKPPPPDPTGLANSQNLQQQIADKKKAEQKDPQRAQEEEEQKQQQKERCDELRERLNVLNAGGRATTVDSKGNVNYLSDEERDKKMAEIEGQIEKSCGGGGEKQ
ncbi:MAG TPA: DUF4124 domain-containing protein [Gammaproteobacteria bacterium]|jgi:hypothetical protein|nr:DUF4124 domain-containing protein [Gammaproteobacteria bacterium]